MPAKNKKPSYKKFSYHKKPAYKKPTYKKPAYKKPAYKKLAYKKPAYKKYNPYQKPIYSEISKKGVSKISKVLEKKAKSVEGYHLAKVELHIKDNKGRKLKPFKAVLSLPRYRRDWLPTLRMYVHNQLRAYNLYIDTKGLVRSKMRKSKIYKAKSVKLKVQILKLRKK